MKLALAIALLASWQVQTVAPFSLDGPVVSTGADGTAFVAGLQGSTAEGDTFVEPPLWARGAAPLESAGLRPLAARVDASGAVTALVAERGSGRLAAAVAPPGAGLGDPAWLSAAGRRVKWGELAVAPGGAAVATWVQRDGGHWRVVAAVREPGAAVFGTPRTVSGAVSASTYVMPAVSSRADVLLVWTGGEWFKPAYASLRRPGGRYSKVVLVGDEAGEIKPAIGEDGTAVLSLIRVRPQSFSVFVAAPVTAGLGRAQSVPCSGVPGAAAVAANGRVMVVCRGDRRFEIWEGFAGLALRRTDRFTARGLLGDEGVRANVGPDGRAVLTWSAEAPARRVAKQLLVAAARPPGELFGPPKVVSPIHLHVNPVAARVTPGGGTVVIAQTFDDFRPGGLSVVQVDSRVAGWISTGW